MLPVRRSLPVSELATWLGMLTRIDPLTYAVDAMRRT